jgi:HlyD family secretion protein
MQDTTANYAKSSKPFVRPLTALFTTAILTMGGITAYSLWQSSQTGVESNPVPSVPEIKTVTALGRLEPSGEVIQVSAPSSNEGNRVEELLVKKGERVAKGQIIAILDSRASASAALKQAEEQVRVAQANLAQVKAGAKTGEIEAQKAAIARIEAERSNNIAAQEATVARLEAALKNSQVKYQRYQKLYADGVISASQAELDLAYIKAPQAGQILDILTRPGEVVSSDGIARIGQTSQMYAVAEVYESDIGKIQVGQQVTVTSNAISGELHGTVEQIGLEVQRQEVINTDPAANIDAKVVEVKVRLDRESSQKVAGLTNLLVKVSLGR